MNKGQERSSEFIAARSNLQEGAKKRSIMLRQR
jgi:hypothetical protein